MSEPLTAAQRVAIARHPQRPNITDYIQALFTDFFEQKGDRLCGEDAAILGGVALYHGRPVTVIGTRKGKTLEENLKCNFGMPNPEGYRKALRLMRQAEKFRRPILTFIDTSGAYPGLEAEAHGQGEAIARNLYEMSRLTVPVIALITGEGNSGGALALGVANRVLMLENSVYAILSPEGFASILWKDSAGHEEACELMKLTAPDLLELGVIDGIIPEPEGGAHLAPAAAHAAGGPGSEPLPGGALQRERSRSGRRPVSKIQTHGRSTPEGGSMSGIKIRGTGRFAPAKIVTNDDLAKIVDTSDEWITTRTGIQTRHHCTTETHTDMCVGAARQALENAGISPEDIGACVVATLSSDYLSPSAACMVQRGLGLPHDAVCFDLNAACSGFLFAIHTMECLLAQAPRKYGLVIGAEMLSRFINWEDRGTCVLFGDGAGAVVVEWREDYPSIHAVLGCHGDPDMLGVTGAEKPAPARIFMHGQPTFKFAVKAVPYCIDQVLEKAGMAIEDVDFFVFHQANARIIDLAAKKYHIPPEKYYKNIQKYGNTSAASIPLVISELHDLGKVGPGSRVLVVGFGGGLTWGGALVEFA